MALNVHADDLDANIVGIQKVPAHNYRDPECILISRYSMDLFSSRPDIETTNEKTEPLHLHAGSVHQRISANCNTYGNSARAGIHCKL